MMKGWLNPTSTPEKLLMDYAATRNQKYITLLVAQLNLPLYHFLLSLSDKELAEDVLQTTWLKVMKIAGKDYSHTNVKNWLFTIARNTLIDELRIQQKWQWQELHDEAITALPFYQREAFIFQQEGFTVIEICQLTNESFETVKSRLRYARNNLRTLLGTRS